jgi:hypothetical protein
MRQRWAYFWTQDFTCAPEEISRLLNLTPSAVWIAGQTKLSSGKSAPRNAWKLESDVRDDQQLDAHIESLLQKIGPHIEELRARLGPMSMGINCVAYFRSHQGNGFHFSEALIHELARHRLSVDFDLYGSDDS